MNNLKSTSKHFYYQIYQPACFFIHLFCYPPAATSDELSLLLSKDNIIICAQDPVLYTYSRLFMLQLSLFFPAL